MFSWGTELFKTSDCEKVTSLFIMVPKVSAGGARRRPRFLFPSSRASAGLPDGVSGEVSERWGRARVHLGTSKSANGKLHEWMKEPKTQPADAAGPETQQERKEQHA